MTQKRINLVASESSYQQMIDLVNWYPDVSSLSAAIRRAVDNEHQRLKGLRHAYPNGFDEEMRRTVKYHSSTEPTLKTIITADAEFWSSLRDKSKRNANK
jgi:hypothetical protein